MDFLVFSDRINLLKIRILDDNFSGIKQFNCMGVR